MSIFGGGVFQRPIDWSKAYSHGTITSATEIDLALGGVHLIVMGAASLLTFKNWASQVPPTGGASSCTLLLVDSATYEPSWSTLLQTEGEAAFTYAADKTIVLEFLNALGGDYVPYMGLQPAADIFGSLLSAELGDDPTFSGTAFWTESANMSVTGGQLVLTAAATAETTVEATPFVGVVGAAYLVVTVIDEVTTAGGGMKVVVGGASGETHTTVGTHAEVIVATGVTGMSIDAVGAAMTAKVGSVSVKRLY